MRDGKHKPSLSSLSSTSTTQQQTSHTDKYHNNNYNNTLTSTTHKKQTQNKNKNKSPNKGLISADRSNKTTLLLTIPSPIKVVCKGFKRCQGHLTYKATPHARVITHAQQNSLTWCSNVLQRCILTQTPKKKTP